MLALRTDPAAGSRRDGLHRSVIQPADRAWMGLGLYVVGVNVLAAARGTEMLSEGCDRYLLRHRWVTEVVMAALYCHLSNRVPDRYDPIHLMFAGVKVAAVRLRRKGVAP